MVWCEWQGYRNEIKVAWEVRAQILNEREVPGMLIQYPAALGNSTQTIMQSVLISISNEWMGYVKKMKNILKKIPVTTSRMILHVRFGREAVEIRGQKYKTFDISYLLLLTLFGPNFTNIPQCFILSNTKRQIVMHMDSMEVVRKVFEIKGCVHLY